MPDGGIILTATLDGKVYWTNITTIFSGIMGGMQRVKTSSMREYVKQAGCSDYVPTSEDGMGIDSDLWVDYPHIWLSWAGLGFTELNHDMSVKCDFSLVVQLFGDQFQLERDSFN